MRILYKPFALIASFIGARIGRQLFRSLWSRIDDRKPPPATSVETGLPKVVAAAALEAATMAATGAAVDHASAKAFHYLTGIHPSGEDEKEE